MHSVLQTITLLMIAPLVHGIIRKTKALLQRRKGPPLIQSYLDIMKLLRRESVVSSQTTWLTSLTPSIYLSAFLVVASMVPIWSKTEFSIGDIIVFIYLFALARFFLALAALEPGSAFGGMGSSREMMIAALIEPVIILGLFGMVSLAGTTDIYGIGGAGKNSAGIMAFIGLMIVTIAETGRIPIDNPDTHLELTMVHEGMLLEYAGRQLGFLHLGSLLKQTILLALLVHLFFPSSYNQPIIVLLLLWFGKIALLGVVLALIESITAKMRLFKLPELIAGGAAFCLLSLVLYSL